MEKSADSIVDVDGKILKTEELALPVLREGKMHDGEPQMLRASICSRIGWVGEQFMFFRLGQEELRKGEHCLGGFLEGAEVYIVRLQKWMNFYKTVELYNKLQLSVSSQPRAPGILQCTVVPIN